VNILELELLTLDLQKQREFYADVLKLSVKLTSSALQVRAGRTNIIFTQALSDFEGVYHFAFNIPENQFHAAKAWISSRVSLLRDENGNEEFHFEGWNSHSLYFKDAVGNVLEFIARHNLKNVVQGEFDSSQILNVSEIGLASEDVLEFVHELRTRLNVSPFMQEPNEQFTAVGDDNGLFILPIIGRIWIPNTGVPAKPLPVTVTGEANGKAWKVRGVPYEISI
jgi:catechol 2,3-dioxygenase-like lactoylglutathione lyase family enzyme